MTEYVTVWEDGKPTTLRWAVPVVRCQDCREVRHEPPVRVGDSVLGERWFCRWWGAGNNCRTLPEAFCYFGEKEGKSGRATGKEVRS